MGRVRDRCASDAFFLEAMAAALNWSINGEWDRRETERQHVEAVRVQLKMLEDHARTRPNADELLRRLPNIEAIAEAARHQILTRTGIPNSAPRKTWHLYVPPGESRTAPGYGFSEEPLWDHDDVAEYCLLKEAEESHRRVLLRWLVHQWAVRKTPDARVALAKTFQPLVESLLARHRRLGSKELGDEYDARAGEYLRAALVRAIDEFDFFYKRYDPVLRISFDQELDAYRRLGVVTAECELPIGNYLKGTLTAVIRGFLGIERRNPNRLAGPFRVRGFEDRSFLLVEDATILLGVSETQVRRRLKRRQLRAWRPRELRDHLALSDDQALVLVSKGGELDTKGNSYWIIDAQSVMELRARKGPTGTYELGRRGRPRKTPKATPGGSIVRHTREPSTAATDDGPSRRKRVAGSSPGRPRTRSAKRAEAGVKPGGHPAATSRREQLPPPERSETTGHQIQQFIERDGVRIPMSGLGVSVIREEEEEK